MKQPIPENRHSSAFSFILGLCPGILPLILLFACTNTSAHSATFYHLYIATAVIFSFEYIFMLRFIKSMSNSFLIAFMGMGFLLLLWGIFIYLVWGVLVFRISF